MHRCESESINPGPLWLRLPVPASSTRIDAASLATFIDKRLGKSSAVFVRVHWAMAILIVINKEIGIEIIAIFNSG